MKGITIVLILLGISSCTKEEIMPREYPRVLTYEVMGIGNGGAMFSGEIYFIPGEVLDHGFAWTITGFPALDNPYSEKKSFGVKEGTGSFEWKIAGGLQVGKTYAMRAYARSATYIVYGKTFDFVAK